MSFFLHAPGLVGGSGGDGPAARHVMSGDQTGIAATEVAVTDLAGLAFPSTPDGAKRYLVEVEVDGDAVGGTFLDFVNVRVGANGTVADALRKTITQASTAGRAFLHVGSVVLEGATAPGASDLVTVSVDFSGGTANAILAANTQVLIRELASP